MSLRPPTTARNRFGLTAHGVCDKESEMGTSEAKNARRKPSEIDEADRNRMISQALDLASVTCRLLHAWHSGVVDTPESMERLWESLSEIRSSRPVVD
jgi:hypothetical protein